MLIIYPTQIDSLPVCFLQRLCICDDLSDFPSKYKGATLYNAKSFIILNTEEQCPSHYLFVMDCRQIQAARTCPLARIPVNPARLGSPKIHDPARIRSP
jgi:hypothetical protein